MGLCIKCDSFLIFILLVIMDCEVIVDIGLINLLDIFVDNMLVLSESIGNIIS